MKDTCVYLLQHSYEFNREYCPNECIIEETKTLGIYSSRKEAEKAIVEIYKDKPGFKNHPLECFHIDEYRINESFWVEGFGIDD
ncbi:hypothetical protein [Bacillus sp. FJAT-27445]|uniref:DUF7336 domain-containing protein n=1 Tax=Bacillus sp. FJAT-27445 TaxID=1679166 RepID=UPI0007441C64|nr:hypothetical protein [Bacillus sp. FJAT-27445]